MLLRSAFAFALLLAGCQIEDTPSPDAPSGTPEADVMEATALGTPDPEPDEPTVAAARADTSWRAYAQRDTAAVPPARAGARDTLAADSGLRPQRGGGDLQAPADTALVARYAAAIGLPFSGSGATENAGVYVQTLLDRARFSPGIIDGAWGQNTEKAVYWLQRRENLPATGTVDRATLERLVALADAPEEPDSLLGSHTLTEDDVAGPFVEIPDDVYAQAELDRMAYQSLGEKLGETFHAARSLLARLNPGSALDSLRAGATIRVPDVRTGSEGPSVARIVISTGGRYLHAFDNQGRLAYHFPTTVGSSYDPSPSDTLEITGIALNPNWHYQPAILEGVDSSRDDAIVPAGPNNAVGTVWMALSKPHYGIHGTAHPETIGYVSSAGCVRLTNWDAERLADRASRGVTVAFRERDGRQLPSSSASGTRAPGSSADSASTAPAGR